MRTMTRTASGIAWSTHFAPVSGYLNAATVGLPPLATVEALTAALRDWQYGAASAAVYDDAVSRSRSAYARLVAVPPSWVSVGSQVSVMVGMVAGSIPDNARVLTVADDFTSVQFPFLAQAYRGVTVRQVPLSELAASIGPEIDVVAFSLVQSSDGRVADVDAVLAAARAVGAMTVCDTTQAVGWLPVAAERFDVTVCAAYKWLCSPRGVAFMTTTPEALRQVQPSSAGWYAGESVWESVYGPGMQLAQDARRLDVSPAWLAWVGAAPALEFLAELDGELVRRHDIALADLLRAALGLPPGDSPFVCIDDPDGAIQSRLAAAGCAVAGRAGRVRMGFHLWNDPDDVHLVVNALSAG